jgi:[ribosomal protein S5]-alanine N-acetyltransferase
MRNISLLAIEDKMALVLELGAEKFAASFGPQLAKSETLVREVVEQTLAMMAAVPREPCWGGYLTVDVENATVVGTCGFKSGPLGDGSVEIAYFTFPEFEGQGFATAMAEKLIALALASPAVRHIIAHTLPEPNASGRILTKVGMQWMGEVDDPEDGKLWRWQYRPSP